MKNTWFRVVLILVLISSLLFAFLFLKDLDKKSYSFEQELLNKQIQFQEEIEIQRHTDIEDTKKETTQKANSKNSCIKDAKEKYLAVFQNTCAIETDSESDKQGCYEATFDDFEEYAIYSKTRYPNGETARLWNSYQQDVKMCY